MPELLLMRHAKSAHPPGLRDRDRPLNERGERSAAAIGSALRRFGLAPDLLLTSPARRAADTARLCHQGAEWQCPIVEVDEFYGTGAVSVIAELGRRWSGDRVLAVGHEPTWSAAVSLLIGGGTVQMVTAAVACIELAPPPQPGAGWLRWMLHPRLLTT